MTEIRKAGETNALNDIDVPQGEFRSQIAALTDAVRQLGGNPDIAPSGPGSSDPLSAPYVLYVNSQIGDDTFVAGDYAAFDDGSYEAKMRRISNQRLECGYTEARPFRTINRAVIEAGIITSRDYLNLSPAPCGDLVTIVVASGQHIVDNNIGEANTSPWSATKEPTAEELRAFNPSNASGVIIPRGCSVISLDLRKTILRPDFVPANANEAADLSNRGGIFNITGGCYFYGMTFMDKLDHEESHHLLDVFRYATRSELDEFYSKIRSSFGAVAGIDSSYAVTRDSEIVIVGPAPASGQTETTDTVVSASPYIYNVSLRSTYGMCGMIADGDRAEGFKSMVVAQYTGVSLQKDLSCWQKYSGGTWGAFADYADYISTDPDNVRANPNRRNHHIRATNDAVIQVVSVFAIGQAIHHLAESGAQITITNSNSNWGGCGVLAIGHTDRLQAQDTPWSVNTLRRPLDPFEKSLSVSKIYIGSIDSSVGNDATTLTLEEELNPSRTKPNQPGILTRQKYSFKEDDYLWVENPNGEDYRAQLAATPYLSVTPDQIKIKAALETDSGSTPGTDPTKEFPPIAGRAVYIRRFSDTRTKEERSYYLDITASAEERTPVRDYILRDVDNLWPDNEICSVLVSKEDRSSNTKAASISLRNNTIAGSKTHSATEYYHSGDSIARNNKFYTAINDSYGAFDPADWDESFVHMQSSYEPEGRALNAAPLIIFDGDTDSSPDTTNCGFTLASPVVKAQYESGTDYKGMAIFLSMAGLSISLVPTASDDRNAAVSTEDIGFYRPSNIRAFNHAWEWSGFANYTKALPQYQGSLSDTNKFTYLFTNEAGGRVYPSGFNEEGYQVTSNGLIDIETGDVLRPWEPDGDNNILEVVPAEVRDRTAPDAKDGIVYLAGADQLALNGTEKTELDSAVTSNPDVITEPWLDKYLDEKNYIVTPGSNDIAVIHVIPEGATPLTGDASVPYRYPEGNPALPYVKGISNEAKTVTEAFEIATRIFVPAGGRVLISVHADVGVVEEGPLQVGKSFAKAVVAGARGSSLPKIQVNRNQTQNASVPEVSSEYSFSAGVVFVDCELECDMVNTTTQAVATLNGGFGVGSQNTTLTWIGGRSALACSSTYGGSVTLTNYQDLDADIKFIQRWNGTVSDDAVMQFMGSTSTGDFLATSGLVGHGSDIIFDFRNAGVGPSYNNSFTYKFENNTSNSSIPLTLLNMGGRGGCKTGGRVLPEVAYDFSNDGWDLSNLISINWLENTNYHGLAFTVDIATNPTFGLSAASRATITDRIGTDPFTLKNGSTLDIDNESEDRAGFFALLLAIEEQEAGGTPSTEDELLLKALNTHNAYIYGGLALRNDSTTAYDPANRAVVTELPD